jgi:hypothetical protein
MELSGICHYYVVDFTVKEEITPVARDRLSSIDNGNHIGDGLAEGSFSDDEDDIAEGNFFFNMY